jgi:protein TonB
MQNRVTSMKVPALLIGFVFTVSFLQAQEGNIQTIHVSKPKPVDTVSMESLPSLPLPDAPADFVGGQQALAAYIPSHIHYPQEALDHNIKGTVVLLLKISPEGKVSKVEVVRQVGGGCDEEAVHMAEGMPAWKPAHTNGQHVESLVYLPVVFLIK